jgi:DNA-binding CsgD family transcriptional regulator
VTGSRARLADRLGRESPRLGMEASCGCVYARVLMHGAVGSDVSRPLSPREFEVLRIASQGLTNAEIAERMEVTVHAVKFHLASIYRKLGVANRTEAAVVFLRSNGEVA